MLISSCYYTNTNSIRYSFTRSSVTVQMKNAKNQHNTKSKLNDTIIRIVDVIAFSYLRKVLKWVLGKITIPPLQMNTHPLLLIPRLGRTWSRLYNKLLSKKLLHQSSKILLKINLRQRKRIKLSSRISGRCHYKC